MKKKKVIYIYFALSTFVKKDIDILSSRYKIKTFDFYVNASAKWKILVRFIQQFFFLLRHGLNADLVVCQFAGYHTFLPVLLASVLGKPSLIVAGGTESVAFPSIRFGNFQRKYLRFFTKWSLKHSTHISPKHESLWWCPYTYTTDDYSEQGIKFFIPKIKTPHTVIYNGYDGTVFKPTGAERKNNFLTVTAGMEYSFQKQLKGIDLMLEVAPEFPEYTFTIVGATAESGFPDKPSNVILYPKLGQRELIDMYSSSRYYMQLSLAEGFPNALCESMLCGCVPFGSSVFSLPEIIDNTGYILEHKDADLLKALIRKALSEYRPDKGQAARQRILDNYGLEKRVRRFSKLTSDLIEK